MHQGFRLGHILEQLGYVTAQQLDAALQFREQTRCRLGEALLELGFCTEVQVAHGLAEQLGMPFVDLAAHPPAPRMLQLISGAVARQYGIVPARKAGDEVLFVVRNPFDFTIDGALRQLIRGPVLLACGVESQISYILEHYETLRTRRQSFAEVAPEPSHDPASGITQLNQRLSAYLSGGGQEVEIVVSAQGARILAGDQRESTELASQPAGCRVHVRRPAALSVTVAIRGRGNGEGPPVEG
jgi:hypothetical protein